MKSSAIGKLCIGDDTLALREALCYLEMINCMEAYWVNAFVLGTTPSLANQTWRQINLREETHEIVSQYSLRTKHERIKLISGFENGLLGR